MSTPDVDAQLAEADARPFTGWDFSWLGDRMHVTAPWDYRAMVAGAAQHASTMLDMGTGGGEFLSGLPALAAATFATEAWPPNVALAGARLRAIGVPVVRDEGAIDNVCQADDEPRGRLPFRTGAFDLVVNRHEAFNAQEVARVVSSGGLFLTQQVDNGNLDDAYERLGGVVASHPSWLDVAMVQLERAGFTVEHAERGDERYEFADAGAFAWYLKAVTPLHRDSPAFSIGAHREALRRLRTPIVVVEKRWVLRASRVSRS